MAQRKPKGDAPITYLLKRDDKFYNVPGHMIDTLSVEEAFRLGLSAHLEQRRQLLEDAIKGDHYIEDVKVVQGLEDSLKKLEELFPSIRQQILDFDKGFHIRMGRS